MNPRFEAVQRVAQTGETVARRVTHLRQLAGQVVDRYLVLAEALYREHAVALWQVARTPEDKRYCNEEAFWDEAIAEILAARGLLSCG